MSITIKNLLLLALIIVLTLPSTTRAVMSSGNYSVTADVLSDGGGDGMSSSYSISGTMWQTSAGSSTSASYSLVAGYWNGGDDTSLPTGTVTIDGGSAYTGTTSVILNLSASSPSGSVTQMSVSNDGVFDTETWESYATSKNWTFAAGDGTKTVYVRYKDSAGYVSYTASDDIIHDTTAPTDGTLIATAQNTSISLTWSGFSDATSGIGSYKLVYSTTDIPASCSAGTAIYTGTGTSYTHDSLVNGTTYYYRICVTDNAGNTSTGVTASATPFAPEGLSLPSSDTGTAGIERTDGGDDSNNFEIATTNPKVDIEYTFEIILKDSTGNPPQYAKLYISQRNTPGANDFHAYDLFPCTGDIAYGATCSFTTMLGPAATHQYYFEAKLADGSTKRYPALTDVPSEITGPTISLLNGYSIVGVPRDITFASLDGPAGMDCTTVYRWVSEGFSTNEGGNNGGYELVTTANPLKPGEGYFVKRETCASATLPEFDIYNDIIDSSYTVTLSSGWNMVSNPYSGNLQLSDVQVQKDADTPVTWTQAATNGWVINAIYYYNGSDWGKTYTSESAGGNPDATLTPWLAYWIYLHKTDGTYYLVIPKP